MPVECAICSTEVDMPFQCKYCKDPFCIDHRLPEKHECIGLENGWEPIQEEQETQSKNDGQIQTERDEAPFERISTRERIREEFETVDAQVMGTTPESEEIIDDRSPDVASDGSLIQSQSKETEERAEESNTSKTPAHQQSFFSLSTVGLLLLVSFACTVPYAMWVGTPATQEGFVEAIFPILAAGFLIVIPVRWYQRRRSRKRLLD
ncbi:AN1-type zinc finger domain-containing protein [Natronoarchaeum sp. GCM10025703]|uniref:AN1-type zinc finger domain-containing protein n=1 Tax=unclassified Natronoarchaeum TaxID=2620183 RepID=UPI0036121701